MDSKLQLKIFGIVPSIFSCTFTNLGTNVKIITPKCRPASKQQILPDFSCQFGFKGLINLLIKF